MSIEDAKEFWQVASTFPTNKEEVYPGHAEAHGFDKQRGKVVLEYGCGGGSDTLSLLRRDVSMVLFVDIVYENVRLTESRVAKSGLDSYLRAAGSDLETSDDLGWLRAEDFDTITSHGVLHHIPESDLELVLSQFYRLLKPGGHLYAMLYTEMLFARSSRRIEKYVAEGLTTEQAFGICTDGGGIARAYTESGGIELFARHGFQFVAASTYNNGDFRTFELKKPEA